MLRIAMSDTNESPLDKPRHLKQRLEAEATGTPFLYWLADDREQYLLMLGPDRIRVTIGRREQSDVPLTWDGEVSRVHAFLEPIGEEWTLIDDGRSRNGSFINGSRVVGRQRLSDRDRMCFGNTHVVFREPTAGDGSESTARRPSAPSSIILTEKERKVLIALCRPIVESNSTTPATNPQIAAEVYLSVDSVKSQMHDLFARFGLADLPQNEKRQRLVQIVLGDGLLAKHDF
jgi:hypothetical protein